jgi:TRAP transporter TAXI family solute receptor
VGPEGSGLTAKTLIQQFALPDRIVVDQTLSLSDAADALAAGQIEGAIIVAADPVDVVERAVAKGARVIPIPKQDLQRLRADYPFLRPGAIPAATYAGVPQPVATLLVDVLLVTRADLDDELVRQLTSALFEILPDLAGRFPYLGLMNMQRAPASPIPLHPGAALFYRERELSR